ncbi:unnamed protein product [Protopolystoma xenopodis]|uniref:EF-hand domain-containing protein n=1 Tax=Protopolystoma xenopodis TaxID=117903 RepID=A0A448WDZ0_9PLAT|nr:unnamed protein product [Protopolystoma xenopodis]
MLAQAGEVSFPIIHPTKWQPQGPGGANRPDFGLGTRLKEGLFRLRELRPKFTSVLDCLYYIFEEPFQYVQIAFKRMDIEGNNRIYETDCIKVLREFGLNVDSAELTRLLKPILSYKESSTRGGWSAGLNRTHGVVAADNTVEVIRPGLVPYLRLLKRYQYRGYNTDAGRLIAEIR